MACGGWGRQLLLLLGALAAALPAQAVRVGSRLRATNEAEALQIPVQPAAIPPNATAAVPGYAAPAGSVTFQSYYNSYTTGRGIWKWSNALDAYQRHFSVFAGHPLQLAEVGVQSGGSILMWQTVLGPKCHVYGIDINPQTNQFSDALSTITIGDQADVSMWGNFYTNVVKDGPLNILVDDGGHEPNQMYVTLVQSFEKISDGGMVAIEDIHGLSYVDSFFVPAAAYLGIQAQRGLVDSVHLYPFIMIAQRAGATPSGVQSKLQFTGSYAVVAEFAQLWEAIPLHPGGHVILENPGWGPFLTAQGLANFFKVFGPLAASTWHDTPQGCERTAAATCAVVVHNAPMQAMITGIHIYPTRLVVEVAGGPVVIQAVRHGSVWLNYG